MGMVIESKPVGPFAMNCYVIGCSQTKAGAIIDAGEDMAWIERTVSKLGLDIKYLLQTHAHIDHVGALGAAKAKWSDAPICIHRGEMMLYEQAPMQGMMFGIKMGPLPKPDHFLNEGDVIELGALRFKVMLTSGHTPGGVSFIEETQKIIFTGDTLFAGSIGRTDLPGGDYPQLVKSLKKLWELPESWRVLSGHGPETSIGRERRSNPFMLSEFGKP